MATSLFAGPQAAVPCWRCHRSIRLDDSRGDLKVINRLYRLRCSHPECGFVDWYLECEFICHHGPAKAALQAEI
jgi:hypothetical protein